MLKIIEGIIAVVFLLLKNSVEKEQERKKENEQLLKDWKDALNSKDKSRITAVIDRMRK